MAKDTKLDWIPLYVYRLAQSSAWSLPDYQFCWYLKLLIEATMAARPGYLPNDIDVLWRLAGARTKAYFQREGQSVLERYFVRTADGLWIYNERLVTVIEAQTKKLKRATKPKDFIGDDSLSISESDFVVGVDSKTSNKTEIPTWVPEKAWMAFVEMRVKMRKPLTEKAKDLAIKRLKEVCELGLPAEEVIYESVMNSWLSFYPPKDFQPRHSSATVGMDRR